ncbi:hypothetical protein [Methylobacterium nigriterrae]|uniref:hypothetical protein n=1 Tax=Methylobacterium nigriterrae TaxID=3127512 RepID=UPI003013E5E9
MAVTADILRRLGKLRLEPEAFEEVLSIIADLQSVDEARRAGQRERTARHRAARRDGNVTVTTQERDAGVTQVGPNDPSPLPPRTPPITPTPNTSSDPDGSGSLSEPTPADPRRDLFARGLPELRRMTGRAEPQCRSLLGKWLKVAEDSAIIVMVAIDDAAANEVASPIPYIEAIIRREAQRNGSRPSDLLAGSAPRDRRSGTVHSAVSAAVARHADRRGVGLGSGPHDPRSEDPRGDRPRRHDPEIEDADWSPAAGYRAAH